MRRLAASILVAALAVATAGCFNPFAPRIAANRGISVPAPVPDSPRNVLLLFQWCWEHRDYTKYREIFTDDFRYVDTGVDSAGNTDLSQVQTRDDELESAKHLFVGGKADEPPANRITLDFNSDLVALPDLRPGKTDQTYHKVIQTTVTLNVDTDAQNFRILWAQYRNQPGDSQAVLLNLYLRDMQTVLARMQVRTISDQNVEQRRRLLHCGRRW